MTEDALRSKKAVMNMNPAAKDPTPDTFVGIKMSGDFSDLALESDILANIEAEKAASVKATRDKRQKLPPRTPQKFKLNSRSKPWPRRNR